jgi:hypothetical protein
MMIRSGSDEPLTIGVPPMTVFLVMIGAICFLHAKKIIGYYYSSYALLVLYVLS